MSTGRATSTQSRPLRKDAAANRDRIMCAAAEVFAESGFDATIDDVAIRAGVGVGTVYRRFSSKADLVTALFEGQVVAIQGLAEEALLDPDPWHGLVGFLKAVQERQSANRGLSNALFDRGMETEGIAMQRHRLHALAHRLVVRAQEQGRLRDDFAATDIPLMLLMTSTIDRYTSDTTPGLSARMLGMCIDGLRTARRHPTALPVPPLTVDQFDQSIAAWHPCPEAGERSGGGAVDQ